jgi:superfamily II DNA or RNA helicase
MKLRPYQERGVTEIRGEYAKGRRAPLYVLSTGGGKTYTFCYVAQAAAAKGNRVCILVHRKRLLKQASRSLASMGIEHGVIAPGFSATPDDIQVASIQTLMNRIKKHPERHHFDLLIPDEAHHATSSSWRELFTLLPQAKILGVTATPARTDGQGLGVTAGGIFDAMVIGPSMRELIDMGNLVEPVLYAPPGDLDMSGVKVTKGEYEARETEERIGKSKIVGDAIKYYGEMCKGQPAAVFTITVDEAKRVAAKFNEAGYRAVSIDGTMEDDEIDQAILDLETGKVQVLVSCDMVSEGFDLPAIAAAFLLCPTKSIIKYLQQIGRSLRPSPGKDHALIFDHVGNCFVHGLPDEEQDWTLNGKPKRKRGTRVVEPVQAVRQCDGCYAVFKPASHCPKCGKEQFAGGRKISEVDGELEKMNAEKIAAERKKRALRIEIAMATSMDELRQIALREGYATGWAYHKWHARKRKAA